MEKRIPIAIVGLGRSGWNLHVNSLRDRGDFHIVDVADPDGERRKEAASELGCRTHEGIQELLEITDAEVVVVATPSFRHESDAIRVLDSGRHCVLEKPIATSHAGALRIGKAAKETGKSVFPYLPRRFGDEFRYLKGVIESNILGSIFEMRLFWGGFSRRNDWQTLAKNGGGLLNNNGPHALDFALNLIDAPVISVVADLQQVKDAGDTEDHVHLMLKTEKGLSADITITNCCALPAPRTILMGSSGTLLADDEKMAKIRYFDASAMPALEVVDGAAKGRRYGSGEQIPWKDEEHPIKAPEPDGSFYDNVAGVLNGREKAVVSLESAVEVTRIIECAHRAIAEKTQLMKA